MPGTLEILRELHKCSFCSTLELSQRSHPVTVKYSKLQSFTLKLTRIWKETNRYQTLNPKTDTKSYPLIDHLRWQQIESMQIIQAIQDFLPILFCRQNNLLQSPPQVHPSWWVKLANLRDDYMRRASVRKNTHSP